MSAGVLRAPTVSGMNNHTTTNTRRRTLLAIDAPSLLHRNHHARKGSGLRDKGGRPIWALNGMLRQAMDAMVRVHADLVLFGVDDRATSKRTERFPEYKAGRGEKDAELVDQLDRAEAMLRQIGFNVVTPPGLEADDVTASAAAWAEANDWDCVILTSDRDAFAHIGPRTRVLRLINGGVQASPLLDAEKLYANYSVGPHNYLDFAALRGDKSDNLPGVAGVGEKTAPIMLECMGDMEAVWADIDANSGNGLVATLDGWAEETGMRKISAGLLKKLRADGARERFEFNKSMMAAELIPLTIAVNPGDPGVLPLRRDAVESTVSYLGDRWTTKTALEVLCHDVAPVASPPDYDMGPMIDYSTAPLPEPPADYDMEPPFEDAPAPVMAGAGGLHPAAAVVGLW